MTWWRPLQQNEKIHKKMVKFRKEKHRSSSVLKDNQRFNAKWAIFRNCAAWKPHAVKEEIFTHRWRTTWNFLLIASCLWAILRQVTCNRQRSSGLFHHLCVTCSVRWGLFWLWTFLWWMVLNFVRTHRSWKCTQLNSTPVFFFHLVSGLVNGGDCSNRE